MALRCLGNPGRINHTLTFKREKRTADALLPLQLQDYIDYVKSTKYTGDKGIEKTISDLG
ncbi:hypothetical protein H8Z72_14170 [Xanthomonas citri pv. citri]|uniref:hypothetical protein n=1 Tax=Xanthomonas citri TaxID=346 RepID=UPI00058395D0|nr:hypothetical protein [Xanthomonas citri]QRD62518.1 hypothetical protein H8Z74_08265 [Xanthomonas citri pv. citri]QRD67026.1 hypothetical protein H8Z73_08235 [Xanthomonas citri pv. citri]QRD71611.1 hypothetical protein H8Z72_14170 [Xanthomonas citri pv. citri]CEE22319.1 hypothetical protein XAC3824_280001 [Xanthomonas citri pv. citri]CEE56926.1 hypothetical protein XAC71A_320002 [Xanthomonas citri pv. citri]